MLARIIMRYVGGDEVDLVQVNSFIYLYSIALYLTSYMYLSFSCIILFLDVFTRANAASS